MLKTIKIAGGALLIILILLSSCVIIRRKSVKKALGHAEPEPAMFSTVLKAKITDIIAVKAKIGNGQEDQNFMFDTGAPLAYSFKTKDSFSIAAKKFVKLGKTEIYYGSGSVTLGNVKFNNAGYIVTDNILDEYKEVAGLIGSSLLQTSICELNFADSTIKISNDLKNFTNIQNVYSCAFDPSEGQGTPIVKIAVGKDTLTAFIDTGFDGLIKLNHKVNFPAATAAKQESVWNSKYFGTPGKDHFFYRTYYKVRRMHILGMEMDSTLFIQYHEYNGRNLIGLAFLKKFIVTIDWIHHRIYLKLIKDIHFKKNIYTYGFTCWMQEKQLCVSTVYKGSEFDKAGIKSGDVIVAINGMKDFSESIISQINTNEPGNDTIEIEIKDKKSFTLKKQALFD